MLFNSYIFIFFFLPAVLMGFFTLRSHFGKTPALVFVTGMSLFFYSWFDPRFLWVVIGSVGVNYCMARVLMSCRDACRVRRGKALLAVAVGLNVAALGYFKYTNFFLEVAADVLGWQTAHMDIVLPLGISFFTFQQIVFLIDIHRGNIQRFALPHYAFCVTFFPHLIAGPIIRYGKIMPQLESGDYFRFSVAHVAGGACFFIIGLAKKVLLADRFSLAAQSAFSAAGAHDFGAMQAWAGALAYTFQIYFDFSGYSDMAIGLALLFKLELPVNFNSPYKATGIIDFWRRWHITLSQFLRDFLYIPLGGNKHGKFAQYRNLLITMGIGGLWHGAGWTFVLWGLAHGVMLVVNHAWRDALGAARHEATPSRPGAFAARTLTFLLVLLAWVLFRAPNAGTARSFYRAMAGLGGAGAAVDGSIWILCCFGAFVCFALPNTQEIMRRFTPRWEQWLDRDQASQPSFPAWSPSRAWACWLGALFVLTVVHLGKNTEFIYFQF